MQISHFFGVTRQKPAFCRQGLGWDHEATLLRPFTPVTPLRFQLLNTGTHTTVQIRPEDNHIAQVATKAKLFV